MSASGRNISGSFIQNGTAVSENEVKENMLFSNTSDLFLENFKCFEAQSRSLLFGVTGKWGGESYLSVSNVCLHRNDQTLKLSEVSLFYIYSGDV